MDNKQAKQRTVDLLAKLVEASELPSDAPSGLGTYQGPLVAQLLAVAGAQDAVLDQHRPARVPAGLKKAALELQAALIGVHQRVSAEQSELTDDESFTALEIMLDWTDALTKQPWRRKSGQSQAALEGLRRVLEELEAADDLGTRREVYERGPFMLDSDDLLAGSRALVVEPLVRLRARAGRDLAEIRDASDWVELCDDVLDRLDVAVVPESLAQEAVSVGRAVSLVKRKQIDVLLRWAGGEASEDAALVRAAALLLAGEHEDAARSAAEAGDRPGALRVEALARAVGEGEPWAALGAFLARTVERSADYSLDQLGYALLDRLEDQLQPVEFWKAVLSPEPQMHLPFSWHGSEDRHSPSAGFFAELEPREQAYLWCAQAANSLGSRPLRPKLVEHSLEQARATGAACPLVETLAEKLAEQLSS